MIVGNNLPPLGGNDRRVDNRSHSQNSGSKIESEFAVPIAKLISLLGSEETYSLAIKHNVDTVRQFASMHPLEKDLKYGGSMPS